MIPGDVFDLHGFLLKAMDHSVGTPVLTRLAAISRATVFELFESHRRPRGPLVAVGAFEKKSQVDLDQCIMWSIVPQTFAVTLVHKADFDAFGRRRPIGLYHGTAANLVGISWNECRKGN